MQESFRPIHCPYIPDCIIKFTESYLTVPNYMLGNFSLKRAIGSLRESSITAASPGAHCN